MKNTLLARAGWTLGVLGLVLSASWISGCAVAAVAVGSVVVTEEFQNKTTTATVMEDTDVVWASAKASLAQMTDALIHFDDDHRAAQTRIDNAVVTVHVRNWDVDETEIRITAKKVLVYSPELAEMVQRRIVTDLGR